MHTNIYCVALFLLIAGVRSFAPTPTNLSLTIGSSFEKLPTTTSLSSEESDFNDPEQIVGKKIIVKGDVNGGYVRTCIRNEVSICKNDTTVYLLQKHSTPEIAF